MSKFEKKIVTRSLRMTRVSRESMSVREKLEGGEIEIYRPLSKNKLKFNLISKVLGSLLLYRL